MRPLTRRALLTAGMGTAALATAGVLVQDDVLPGRVRAWQIIGELMDDGQPGSPAAGGGAGGDAGSGAVESGEFRSAARGGATSGWLIAYPPGVDPVRPRTPSGRALPVCVALHGRGATETTLLSLRLDRFLALCVAAGTPPFAIAAVGGGTTYWHARRDGTDSGRMVVEEFLPLLAGRGLAAGTTDRIGLLGWSMGGYGALRLAEVLGPRRVAAVAAASPALWLRPGDSAPGAFDDADDFRRNDVFGPRPALRGVAVRVDCGLGDPFLRATRAFVAGLRPAVAGGFEPGSHDGAYWRRMAPAQLAFLGATLAG